MNISNFKEHPKKEKDVARKKEVTNQAQTVLKMGLDQIIKFIHCYDGPLMRVTYSSLTQRVFIMDTVKYSSCDCPTKIYVDSNARFFTGFTSLVLVAAHPKLRSFVRHCTWSMLSLKPKPTLT
jgi:hypothetical protein